MSTSSRRPAFAFRPRLEILEERALLSVFTVDRLTDVASQEFNELANDGGSGFLRIQLPEKPRMNLRRLFISLTVLTLVVSGPGACVAEPPPNIVFILADDLGWTDLGCMGSRYYETPAIDQLARQGMKFTSYYSCQNCAPTRAALMTGQYAPRTGIYTVGTLERGEERFRKMTVPTNNVQLALDKVTIADALRAAGYRTGMFGKWHLGKDPEHHPSRRGFDEAIVAMKKHLNFRPDPSVPRSVTAELTLPCKTGRSPSKTCHAAPVGLATRKVR